VSESPTAQNFDQIDQIILLKK